MNKKLIYLSLFLVLVIFIISACQIDPIGGKMDSKGGSRPNPPKITNLEFWGSGYKQYDLSNMNSRSYFYAGTIMNADSAGIVSQSIYCNTREKDNWMSYLYSYTNAGLVKDKYGKLGIELSGESYIDISGKELNCNSYSNLMDLYGKYSDSKWKEFKYNPSGYSFPNINDVKLVKLNDGKYYVYLNADNNNGGICGINFGMYDRAMNKDYYWYKPLDSGSTCKTTTSDNAFFEIPIGLNIESGRTYELNLNLYGSGGLNTHGYGSYTWNAGSNPVAIGKVSGIEFTKTAVTKEGILKSQEFRRKTIKK